MSADAPHEGLSEKWRVARPAGADPRVALSRSEYRRLREQGVDVFPPEWRGIFRLLALGDALADALDTLKDELRAAQEERDAAHVQIGSALLTVARFGGKPVSEPPFLLGVHIADLGERYVAARARAEAAERQRDKARLTAERYANEYHFRFGRGDAAYRPPLPWETPVAAALQAIDQEERK